MKRAIGIICLGLAGATVFCEAAELEKKPEVPQGTTNLFSNWIVASSNLTVKTPGSPWGRSLTARVPMKLPVNREFIEAVIQRQALEKEQREREKVLKRPPPAFAEEYQVYLSRTPDHSTNSAAK